MKVLIIGSGGREHALAWAFSRSPKVDKVYCAPGNAGTASVAENVAIKAGDMEGLAAFAADNGVDITMVGPEDPLAGGIVDLFAGRGLPIFGPTAVAARVEASKSFAKHLMTKYGIPTAGAWLYGEGEGTEGGLEEGLARIDGMGAPVVIKADGLAAGKGVIVAATVDEAKEAVRSMLEAGAFGQSGRRVLVEEFLEGEEASILAFTDGRSVLPMASSQDHKRALDGDGGPNTGGMGAYSPAPVVTEEMMELIRERILRPMVDGMAAEGHPYRGILYAGLMMGPDGPKVVEFNCRFGDPETQAVLARLRSDITEPVLAVMEAARNPEGPGGLDGVKLEWDPRPAVCVVMASGGYPGSYEKGRPISGLEETDAMDDVVVFHAGTARGEDGALVTSGGRVLGVTALGEGIEGAVGRAYEATSKIYFDNAHVRKDIAHRALARGDGRD